MNMPDLIHSLNMARICQSKIRAPRAGHGHFSLEQGRPGFIASCTDAHATPWQDETAMFAQHMNIQHNATLMSISNTATFSWPVHTEFIGLYQAEAFVAPCL